MKKLAVFVLVISVFSGAVFGQGQEFTFRGLPWGSSREQVIEKLGVPDQIMFFTNFGYNVKVSGYNASLILLVLFTEGLTSARYQFEELAGYNNIRRQLITRYGEPSRARIPNFGFFEYWSKNNFHVSLMVSDREMEIAYYPDSGWEAFITEYNIDLANFEL